MSDVWHWRDSADLITVRDVFLTVQRLGLMDKKTSFNDFVEWMGNLGWYAKIYKPK